MAPLSITQPNAVYQYIPLVHRLRLAFANANTSKELPTYVKEQRIKYTAGEKRDVWDGRIIRSLRQEDIIHSFNQSNKYHPMEFSYSSSAHAKYGLSLS
jgi:hypothetical protein